jgi:hypothetical protein
MVSATIVKQQLKRIGAPTSSWGKAELAELPKILIEGEEIQHIINGHYEGGFATLCATNYRLLLIDKKMFFLTVEDVRYDMIAEVDYGHQMFGATIHVRSFSKDLKFQGFKISELRDLTSYVQHKVMELRGHQLNQTDSAPLLNKNSVIPMQVFDNTDDITEEQAESLLPTNKEVWYKSNPARRFANPYAQTPLLTRKRTGKFHYAEK